MYIGRPVSQHRGGAAAVAAAAAAVDVLTVATAVVGFPPTDDGAVDDGTDGAGPVPVDSRDGDGDGGDDAPLQLLLWAAADDSRCGETDECRRPADGGCWCCCNNSGGLDDDDEDVRGGGGNSDGCGANEV